MKTVSIATKTKDIAVDLGNAVIKGAINNQSKGIYEFHKFDNKVKTTRGGNPKEIKFKKNNENEIIFGVGSLQNNKLKHEREFLLEQALITTCNLVDEDKFSTKLRVALPPAEFFKDEYVKKYKDKFQLGNHSFTLNGESKEVNITEVSVLMEGYSAFLNVANSIKSTNNLLVFDLGGGTFDCLEVIYDRREKSFFPNRAESVRKGSIDLYACITDEINSKGNSAKLEWVESAIDDKDDDINGRYKISENLSSARVELKSMLNDISNRLECSLKEYDIVCLGGGATIFNMLYEDKSHLLELELKDTLFSNAVGMLIQ